MVFEMDVRGLKENTKTTYIKAMEGLINYHDKSPELLGIQDIKQYQLYLMNEKRKKLSPNSVNRHLSAIRFFYHHILQRKDYRDELPRLKAVKKVPTVFSQQEIKIMIDTLTNIKFKAIFMTLYSTGMRCSELKNLKPEDIDSKRMVIYIRDGKGGKDRQALLSKHLLEVLRTYWVLNKDDKSKYLFVPSRNSFDPTNLSKSLSNTAITYVLKSAAKAAGIKKNIHPHALRHSFAVHLLEQGANLRHIQFLLGHTNIRTTVRYTYIADIKNINVLSPLDDISLMELEK